MVVGLPSRRLQHRSTIQWPPMIEDDDDLHGLLAELDASDDLRDIDKKTCLLDYKIVSKLVAQCRANAEAILEELDNDTTNADANEKNRLIVQTEQLVLEHVYDQMLLDIYQRAGKLVGELACTYEPSNDEKESLRYDPQYAKQFEVPSVFLGRLRRAFRQPETVLILEKTLLLSTQEANELHRLNACMHGAQDKELEQLNCLLDQFIVRNTINNLDHKADKTQLAGQHAINTLLGTRDDAWYARQKFLLAEKIRNNREHIAIVRQLVIAHAAKLGLGEAVERKK